MPREEIKQEMSKEVEDAKASTASTRSPGDHHKSPTEHQEKEHLDSTSEEASTDCNQVEANDFFSQRNLILLKAALDRDPREQTELQGSSSEPVFVSSPNLNLCVKSMKIPVYSDWKDWKKNFNSSRRKIKAATEIAYDEPSVRLDEVRDGITSLKQLCKEFFKAGVCYSAARGIRYKGPAKIVEKSTLNTLLTTADSIIKLENRLGSLLEKQEEVHSPSSSDISDEEDDPDLIRLHELILSKNREIEESRLRSRLKKSPFSDQFPARSSPSPVMITSSGKGKGKKKPSRRSHSQKSEYAEYMAETRKEYEAKFEAIQTKLDKLLQEKADANENTIPEGISLLHKPKAFLTELDPYSDSYISSLPEGFNKMPDLPGMEFSPPGKDRAWPTLSSEGDYDLWMLGFYENVYRYRIPIHIKFGCLRDSIDLSNPKIKEICDPERPDSIGFRSVLQQLYKLFGDKTFLSRMLFAKLMRYSHVNIRDGLVTLNFKTDLLRFVQNEVREGRYDLIDQEHGVIYQAIGGKLSDFSKDRFIAWCKNGQKAASTLSLLQWFEGLSEYSDERVFLSSNVNTPLVQKTALVKVAFDDSTSSSKATTKEPELAFNTKYSENCSYYKEEHHEQENS